MIAIGTEVFRTKKAYEARLRQLKDSPLGTVFEGADLALLIDAEARYDPHSGTHGNAVAFRVGRDRVWTSQQCLNVTYDDGHSDVLSYKHTAACFYRPRCGKAWRTRQARDAILPQIRKFRAEHPTGACEVCGATGTEADMQVDHMQPFHELFSTWQTSFAHDEEWTEFHARERSLQLLCLRHHKEKTKRELSKTT